MNFIKSLTAFLVATFFSLPLFALGVASPNESLGLVDTPIVVTQPSGMFCIPALSMSDPGDIEFSAGMDIFRGGRFGVDMGITYSPIEQLEVGVELVNLNNLVSSMKLTLFELDHLYQLSNFKVGAGFNSIYDTGHLERWENKMAYKANLFSHYLMTSFEWNEAIIHIGIAQPQTELDKGSRDVFSGFFDDLDNIFFGFSTQMGEGQFILEFDTEDIHIGYRHPIKGGHAVEARRYDVLQGVSRFPEDTEPLLEYGLHFKSRHNYFRDLHEKSRRAQSQLETSKKELRSRAKDFEVIQMSYQSLTESRRLLEEKLNSLDLLQKDLLLTKKQFENETRSMRQENSELLRLLKQRKDGEELRTHEPLTEIPAKKVAQKDREGGLQRTPQPTKTFGQVAESFHN